MKTRLAVAVLCGMGFLGCSQKIDFDTSAVASRFGGTNPVGVVEFNRESGATNDEADASFCTGFLVDGGQVLTNADCISAGIFNGKLDTEFYFHLKNPSDSDAVEYEVTGLAKHVLKNDPVSDVADSGGEEWALLTIEGADERVKQYGHIDVHSEVPDLGSVYWNLDVEVVLVKRVESDKRKFLIEVISDQLRTRTITQEIEARERMRDPDISNEALDAIRLKEFERIRKIQFLTMQNEFDQAGGPVLLHDRAIGLVNTPGIAKTGNYSRYKTSWIPGTPGIREVQ